MQLEQDTIVAISTAPGRGGIGIVRLSGAQAVAIAGAVCRLDAPLVAGRIRVTAVSDADGQALDEAVVTYFGAPRSYTTEDVVEIALHGAPVLLEYVVRACLGQGARLAEPGEFTQRAFLAGRLDLTQAEAVHDLIAAQTLNQARVAAAQLGGSVARAIAPVKQALVRLIAELEAGIDFAEDDLELLPEAEIAGRIGAVREGVEALAATYHYGRIVREGFRLAIVGRPNAGKSSLFNRLLERERAIVTAQPGTTRDAISERLALEGIPVELVDTAGLRDAPEGEAERQGIARSRTEMAEADLVLVVVDATTLPFEAEDRATLAAVAGRHSVVALNKADLVEARTEAGEGAIYTSTVTGEGLEELKAAILSRLVGTAPDSGMVTNLRQQEALSEAAAALAKAGDAVGSVPHEMLLMDLHEGLEALDRLTGVTSTDDILGVIFSQFCIGK